MSAYVVNVDHIDYLVSAIGALGAAQHTTLRIEQDPALRGWDDVSPDAVNHTRLGYPTWEPAFDTDQIGRMLLTENIRSVQARYPDDSPSSLPGPIPTPEAAAYKYTPVPWSQITPAGVALAIKCWRYQTCQSDDHATSVAWRVMDELYEMAVIAMIRHVDPQTWNYTRPVPPYPEVNR